MQESPEDLGESSHFDAYSRHGRGAGPTGRLGTAGADSRRAIAGRLRQVRRECYGEDGIYSLAVALGLPARTWENYEHGVTIPGEILLRFLVLTSTSPRWLLTGEGRRLTPP